MTRIAPAVVFAWLAALPLHAQTVFVSPDGDDAAAGDRGAPLHSIERGFAALEPGSTLVLMAGTHRVDGVVKMSLEGTEGAPITIRGEEGARVVGPWDARQRSGHRPTKYSGFRVHHCEHLVMEDLELSNMGGSVFGVAWTDHVTFRRLHIHDYSNYGIISADGKNLLVEDCVIHGSLVEHGIYITGNNDGVTVRGCEFYDTAVNGLHINATNNRNVLVENCTFHHNSRDWGASITLMGTKFAVIRNNVFYCNMGHIFTITKGARDVRILHNTVYQPREGRTGQVFVVRSPLEGFRVRNNVFATNAPALDCRDEYVTDTTTFDHNVYGPRCGKGLSTHGQDGRSTFGAAVRFASAPAPSDARADLRLRAGSPGSSGAPFLRNVPVDHHGEKRTPGGPHGAYATTGE